MPECFLFLRRRKQWKGMDSTRDCLKAAFPMSGFRISAFDMCDCRKEELPKEPDAYDVVILGEGHVPTQNQFLKKSV